MNWKELNNEIDWLKVEIAIIAHQDKFIDTNKLREVNQMVHDAAEYFLPLDLQWFNIIGVEKEYLYTYSARVIPDKGVIDLIFEIKADAGKPYKDYAGKKLIVDWKTTGGEINTEWRNRYIPSWQWKRYAAAEDAQLFEYRGISTKTYWDGREFKKICSPLIIDVPDNNYENTKEDYIATQTQKSSLLHLEVYPRNAPAACYKYGETCLEKSDCDKFSMPQTALVNINHSSYSSDETFKLCPEKYRRYKLRDVREENYDSQSFTGTLVHRGLAEIYNQFKEKN